MGSGSLNFAAPDAAVAIDVGEVRGSPPIQLDPEPSRRAGERGGHAENDLFVGQPVRSRRSRCLHGLAGAGRSHRTRGCSATVRAGIRRRRNGVPFSSSRACRRRSSPIRRPWSGEGYAGLATSRDDRSGSGISGRDAERGPSDPSRLLRRGAESDGRPKGLERLRTWTVHDREQIDRGEFFTFAVSNIRNRWRRLCIHAPES